MVDRFLQAALEYARFGWHVVPVYGPSDVMGENGKLGCTCPRGAACPSSGKHPRLKQWQLTASNDEEVVYDWWQQWPKTNIGVQWGERSGIIDMECDSPEAEKDWEDLWDGTPPICPTYKAARGKHRIVKWRDGLPPGAVLHYKGLEIRTGNSGLGAQSVVPPSKHASGVRYEWLEGLSPDEIEPPEIPDHILARLFGEEVSSPGDQIENGKAYEAVLTGKRIPEGSRDDTLLSYAAREAVDIRPEERNNPWHYERILVAVSMANEKLCDPPLPDSDVKRIVNQAIKYAKDKGETIQPAAGEGELLRWGLKRGLNGAWQPGTWKLTIIESDPREYHLSVPEWEPFIHGIGPRVVVCDVTQFRNPEKMAARVLEVTGRVDLCATPNQWAGIWCGVPAKPKFKIPAQPSLRAQLLKMADSKKPSLEHHRGARVVREILEILRGARALGDKETYDLMGDPTRDEEGVIVFSPRVLAMRLYSGPWRIEEKEVGAVAKQFGFKEFRPRGKDGSRPRLRQVCPASITAMELYLDSFEKPGNRDDNGEAEKGGE